MAINLADLPYRLDTFFLRFVNLIEFGDRICPRHAVKLPSCDFNARARGFKILTDLGACLTLVN
jgi:hypothetical protein